LTNSQSTNSPTTDNMTSSLPKPQKKIELFSGNYFAACTIGGIIGSYPMTRAMRKDIL
jgi:hypothetical protein